MKKLTIGSLKYNHIMSTVSINQPVIMETPTVNETSRGIDIKQNQRYFQVEVKKGQSILDAAIEQNISLDYSCKKGTCGKCKVKLVNGSTYLQPTNSLEEKKLQHLIQNGFRLACQAKARKQSQVQLPSQAGTHSSDCHWPSRTTGRRSTARSRS